MLTQTRICYSSFTFHSMQPMRGQHMSSCQNPEKCIYTFPFSISIILDNSACHFLEMIMLNRLGRHAESNQNRGR